MVIGLAIYILVSIMALPSEGRRGQPLLQTDSIRVLVHNGAEVKTTFAVDAKFIGRYEGHKTGYLLLNADGTGIYKYDVYGFRKGKCNRGEVPFIWGFVLDDEGKIVKFERPYGFSYPVILVSRDGAGFQDCQKNSMVDYLMVRKDGSIAVSSSDDWVKISE